MAWVAAMVRLERGQRWKQRRASDGAAPPPPFASSPSTWTAMPSPSLSRANRPRGASRIHQAHQDQAANDFLGMSSRKRCQRGDGSRLGGEELRPGRPGVTLSLWKIWEAAHSGFSLAGASLVLLFAAAAAARGKPKPRLGFSLCCRRQPTSQQQSDDTKHFWVFPRREWRYRDVIFLCVARFQF